MFSCKSRFCNSCSKPASDKWLNNIVARRPKWLLYHHFTFTIPTTLRIFFKTYRWALDILIQTAARSITYFCEKHKKCKPWIIAVIHTFWARLNRNTHIHIVLTAWWITKDWKYKKIDYFPYKPIKASRKGYLLKNLTERVNQNLDWERRHNEIRELQHLSNQTNDVWEKLWRYVQFSQQYESFTRVISYIGRYLKRPVIAQSRIKNYDWETVTYTYEDKRENKAVKEITVGVQEFIWLLIQHIPNQWFKMVRYYWAFCPRTKKQNLKILKWIYQKHNEPSLQVAQYFRQRLFNLTWVDIWACRCWWCYLKYSINVPWYKTKYFDDS